ncbi:hypothetical protein Moror_8434 [Moniliophthora roreri MCA 2997]|uniref:Secreted protein n=1 Tax=Moniliophthora roreri (strain MCA 2997) TaxID=1381753 RepID=V2WK66_MONRO|nr:hypothetical protein Moror_8434 [Moniliophthora roreri MCA 2997]
MRYIRILLIGLLFAQTSLAIEALSCRCMDKNNLSVNKGTSDGCAWLMKKKNLFENDAWTSKDQHGIVTVNLFLNPDKEFLLLTYCFSAISLIGLHKTRTLEIIGNTGGQSLSA